MNQIPICPVSAQASDINCVRTEDLLPRCHTSLKEEQDTYVLFKTLSSFSYQLAGCTAKAATLALINIKIYEIFVGVSSSADPYVSCTSKQI